MTPVLRNLPSRNLPFALLITALAGCAASHRAVTAKDPKARPDFVEGRYRTVAASEHSHVWEVAGPKGPVKKSAEPKTGLVQGVVVDSVTKAPVGLAILTFQGTGMPPVASDATSGRYMSQEMPAGPTKVVITRAGYREGDYDLVVDAGEISVIRFTLERLARDTRLRVTVESKGQSVPAAVQVNGPVDKQLTLPPNMNGPVAVDVVGGKYSVTVRAPGYLAQTREVEVPEGSDLALAFELIPEPKKSLVVVRDNKIIMLQQIHFATGTAVIAKDSFALLAQVVDAIVSNNLQSIRVEGHTDNVGKRLTNQKLSQDRAESVVNFVVKSGVDRKHLEAKGFGDSRPVAPNLTPKGRKLNRRVEFLILDHG